MKNLKDSRPLLTNLSQSIIIILNMILIVVACYTLGWVIITLKDIQTDAEELKIRNIIVDSRLELINRNVLILNHKMNEANK